jgi:hypothetical protein
MKITVDDGYYTLSQLITFLNSAIQTQTASINTSLGESNVYGFGGTVASTNPTVYYVGFSANDTSNFSAQQPLAALRQSVGVLANTHVYNSFELLVDDDTIGLLSNLGFLYNNLNQPTNNITIKMNCVVDPNEDNTSSTNYIIQCNYSSSSSNSLSVNASSLSGITTAQLVASYAYDMLEVTSLIISMENTISQHRASYDNMRQTDFMLSIPVYNSFGDFITYFDTGEKVASYNVNLNLTSINITIRDQQGRLVDFRGMPWVAQILLQFYDNSDTTKVNAGDLNVHQGKFPNFDQLQTVLPYSFNRDPLFPAQSDSYLSVSSTVKRSRKF